MVLAVIYIVSGYWATEKTTHANKIFMGYGIGELFFERLILGVSIWMGFNTSCNYTEYLQYLGLTRYLYINIFVLD